MEPAVLIIAIVGVIGYLAIRLMAGPEPAAFVAPTFDSTPTTPVGGAPRSEIPVGFRFFSRPHGWSLQSGPRFPCRISAETTWGKDLAPSGWIRVEIDPAPRDSMAMVFAGGLIGWSWTGQAWESALGRTVNLHIGDIKPEERLLEDALLRVGEAKLLHQRMALSQHFSRPQEELLERQRVADDLELAALAHSLVVEVVPTDPSLALHLATHLDAPIVWLGLLDPPSTRAAAYQTLWSRWVGSPLAEAAIRRALKHPRELDETTLATLFDLLERVSDPRLPPFLTRLVSDYDNIPGALTVACLERHGDATALPSLDALMTRTHIDVLPAIERARTAIRFRQQAALSHTAGGLSVAEDGGSLALADNAHTVTQETP